MLRTISHIHKFSQFIKIANWNINGLRSVISKNKIQQYIASSNPDILCMNETRIDSLAYTKIKIQQITPGSHHYLNQCKVKKGYSGVGVITKIKPLNVYYDFEYLQKQQTLTEEEKQHCKEGRLLTLEFNNFYLLNVYKPNAGEMLIRLGYRMSYDQLFNKYISFLNLKKPTIVVGDFNVAPQPIDLTNPKQNLNHPGFTKQERQQFANLLQLGMVDGFRHLYPSKVQYTWWSNRGQSRLKNIGWRIDHILFTKILMEGVVDVKIRGDVFGSDHCPIEAIIDLDSCM